MSLDGIHAPLTNMKITSLQNYLKELYYVDVEKAQPVLDALVSDSRIDLTELANRFCEHSEFGMMMEETELFVTFF